MKILVVGDSFMPSEVFRRAFARLEVDHGVRYVQMDAGRVLDPSSPSEQAIREYEGHPDQIAELLDDERALVVHGAPVTDSVLDAAPSLALVGCARGGPVNIDVAAATERGIVVANTPGKNAESVADLTVAFLVMLARGVRPSQEFLLQGGRLGDSAFEGARFLGHDLGGHVLGLVGFGQVGRRVARRAAAFGMEVLVHDPYLDTPPGAGVTVAPSLGELLRGSDFVSVHARQTAETENMFGAATFAAMKAGAAFVNTAREGLVDERALEEAVRAGHLSGAALDVVRPRPDGSRNPLLDLERVIVTPHIGGATHETLARGARMLAEEIERLAASEALRHVVNGAVLAEG